jgi:pimeloyl-ACP methyl ester carboxylesterase
MANFTSDGVQIAFDDITPPDGAKGTIVLVHGFASNRTEAWKRTGWYAAFERRGVRVLALDQRGHGESQKLYEPQAYERERLAADVLSIAPTCSDTPWARARRWRPPSPSPTGSRT